MAARGSTVIVPQEMPIRYCIIKVPLEMAARGSTITVLEMADRGSTVTVPLEKAAKGSSGRVEEEMAAIGSTADE